MPPVNAGLSVVASAASSGMVIMASPRSPLTGIVTLRFVLHNMTKEFLCYSLPRKAGLWSGNCRATTNAKRVGERPLVPRVKYGGLSIR